MWAIGYAVDHIYSILREEFEDLEVNPISPREMENLIQENRADLNKAKAEMAEVCRNDILNSWRENFSLVAASESKMTKKLIKSMDSLADALELLDLTDLDEKTGKPLHLRAFLDILEAAEKLQKFMGKLSGTDAFRDIEAYKMKAMFDQELKADGGLKLLPAATTTDGRPEVTG